VESKKAKMLKNALEAESLLDKNYRITRATENTPLKEPNKYVAVPVVEIAWNETKSKKMQDLENEIVAGFGKQEVMYSSAILGKMKSIQ